MKSFFPVFLCAASALFLSLPASGGTLPSSGGMLPDPAQRPLLLASITFEKPVRQASKKNVIWLVEPQFSNISDFSEGRAAFEKGGACGYVDADGKIVTETRFIWAGPISDGLRVVKLVKGGPYGYADSEGNIVIAPSFTSASDFSEGLANVKKDGTGYFIDREGKTVIAEGRDFRLSFREGMTLFRHKPFLGGEKIGYADREGKIAVKPVYDFGWDFSEGLAAVRKGEFSSGRWGFIDKQGNAVTDFTFRDADSFSEGLAAVKTADGRYGYIDRTGKMVIEPRFDSAGGFSEGLAAVAINGRCGYIDRTGKTVIEMRFGSAEEFSEGLAAVRESGSDGSYGYIDKTGAVVIEPQFSRAWKFSEGAAVVSTGRAMGILRNPLIAQKREETFETAGLLIGEIHSIRGREIVVRGKNIGETVFLGDRLMAYAGEKLLVLRASFPMQSVTKCELVSGKINDLKPGMKVYKYRKEKRK